MDEAADQAGGEEAEEDVAAGRVCGGGVGKRSVQGYFLVMSIKKFSVSLSIVIIFIGYIHVNVS